jgi:two-component system, NarL family, sensor kinase
MAMGHSALARATAVAAVLATAGLWVFGLVLAGLDGHPAGALGGVGGLGFAIVGALVVWQRPGNRLGWTFCAGALTMTMLGAGGEYATRALVRAPGSLPAGATVGWLADAMAVPTIGLFAGVIPQLFPTGRPLSPRWRVPLWAAYAYLVLGTVGNALVPQQLESAPRPNPYGIAAARPVFATFIAISAVCGAVALVGSLASLVLRWRRAQGDERQQLKWFLAGIVLLPVPLLLHDVAPAVSNVGISAALVIIPVTLGVAILRYRLYELDLIVRRALVYAAVSALIAAIYLAIVALAQLAVAGSAGLGVHVLAAVAAAAGFQPIRSRLQRGVDRLLFGDRSRPYDALSALARRLEAALDPDTVLPGVVESVAHALRVPYVAIELRESGGWHLAAERGARSSEPVSFPMTYQGELIGRMQICPRSGTDALDAADRRLLTDLARQAGVAAHAVRTTTALQRSRADLVAAREEERRRLRRDLHDGLGPTLAGVTLGLRAATINLGGHQSDVQRSLESITGQVEDAIADIRRLVYGLRPPALDEFGLVRAVQMHAARIEADPDSPAVSIDSPPEGLGRLPAAVEVAAYRIVTEAMTNVTKHAQARTCTVRFCLNGSLELDVTDDGRGLPPDHSVGVGLTAMRERAAELGGTVLIEPLPIGTRIRARLPILDAS